MSVAGPIKEVFVLFDGTIAGLEAVLAHTPKHGEARETLRSARLNKASALFLAGSYGEILSVLENPESAAGPSDTLMKQLQALSLAATGDWRRATAAIRKADVTDAAKDIPAEMFRLACIETRCAEAIGVNKDLPVNDSISRQAECEERAIELIKGYALRGEIVPVDFDKWPSVHRQNVDWQLFRTIVETPRFAFILASGYARAANASKEKAGELDGPALEALGQAVARGYFRRPERRQRLATAPEFDRLRRLPAFNELLAQVEKASFPKPETIESR